jgi:hypothetical protein
MRIPFVVLLVLASSFAGPQAARAQSGGADAYADPVARQLVERARAARAELGASVTSYTAVVRQRHAVLFRMPLKDRMLHRSETAARVRWSRDGETVALMLAGREQHPGGVEPDRSPGTIFDPTSDRLYFGTAGADQTWIAHPLAAGSEAHYRFHSGDTLQLTLAEGRRIRAIALMVVPREPSFRYISSTLWIEPESGAPVRAVFRPSRRLDLERDDLLDADEQRDLSRVPGVFKPIEADIESVVLEYSLWRMRHWLPRITRVEGTTRVGMMRLAFHGETSYEILDVQDESDAVAEPSVAEVIASWTGDGVHTTSAGGSRGRRMVVYSPADPAELLTSPFLPPPVWERAPGFVTETELEAFARDLKLLPRVPAGRTDFDLQWGLARSDLVRYNRVEGLSAGARGVAERHGVGEASATARLGFADLRPNLELAFRAPARGRSVSLELYHRLAAMDPAAGALGLGGSLGAFLLGRDDGEYFRATGAGVTLTPTGARRAWHEWRLFAERQREVELGTEWSLARVAGGDPFRPVLAADEVDLVGLSGRLSPWWGRDALRPQASLELFAEAAAGDREFARVRLTGRSALPLTARYRLGMEAAAGTGWGEIPVQYNWFVGGPTTLRGYGGSTAYGRSFVRARSEFQRGSPNAALALFADAAWAGDRDAFDRDDVLVSAGAGASLLDGLLRLDLARALREPRGWRLELYLDAPF